MIKTIISIVALSFLSVGEVAGLSDYVQHLQKRHYSHFKQSCSKYSFVRDYENQLKDPFQNFLISVFSEEGQKGGVGGGLGDRLGGMITAFAYALRTNRTFLLQGDAALGHLFQPFQPFQFSGENDNISWTNWDWAGWSADHLSDLSHLACVNPSPKSTHCALDSIYSDANKKKVIKYYGNRCYLCRWVKRGQDETERQHLLATLGINSQSNLYEAAGCMLRLILHPTNYLWEKVDEFIQSTLQPGGSLSVTRQQVGVHFRCGDSSFDPNNKNKPPNPQCVYSSADQWRGTSFGDDRSYDSPIDLAYCVNRTLRYVNKLYNTTGLHKANQSAVFVASDNRMTAKQILDHMESKNIIYPQDACHIDLGGKHDCSEDTLVQWFILSQSDSIIAQKMVMRSTGPYNDAVSIEEAKSRSPAPISAFSRFAVIYGLSSHHMRYGQCISIDPVTLSFYSHGNWICLPRMFY